LFVALVRRLFASRQAGPASHQGRQDDPSLRSLRPVTCAVSARLRVRDDITFGKTAGVINIAQTAQHEFGHSCLGSGSNPMLTSSECHAQAEDKIAQADREPRNQERLLTAAQAWLILAAQMRQLEASMRSAGKLRSKRRAD
jgi:hypothetical protein